MARFLQLGFVSVMASLTLAGCVMPVQTAPTQPAPVTPPAPVVVQAPKPVTPETKAPVITESKPAPVIPAAPAFSGPVNGQTGMRQSAIMSVTGDATRGYTVLFRPKSTEASSISAAPAKLCGPAGVASSRTNTPGTGSAMPGVQIMVVKCA